MSKNITGFLTKDGKQISSEGSSADITRIDSEIGSRNYNYNEILTDGQSLTESLDAISTYIHTEDYIENKGYEAWQDMTKQVGNLYYIITQDSNCSTPFFISDGTKVVNNVSYFSITDSEFNPVYKKGFNLKLKSDIVKVVAYNPSTREITLNYDPNIDFRVNFLYKYSNSNVPTGKLMVATNIQNIVDNGESYVWSKNGTELLPTTTGDIPKAQGFQLDINSPATSEVGRLTWSASDEAVEVKLNSEVTLQIGQENLIHCFNNSGATIPNGSIVYITGANTLKPTIALARADSFITSNIIGVTTQNILNNTNGFITIQGMVRDINTSGFNIGDDLYLSSTVYGALTNIKPVSPNYIRLVGSVVVKNVINGSMFISVSLSRNMDAEQIFEDMINPNGFPEGQRNNVIINYNSTTRQINISGSFYYYNKGIKYIKTVVNETITHTDSTAGYFIYYVGSVLTISTTPWNLIQHIPIVYVFYNNSIATTFWNGVQGIAFDERHGIIMDGATHTELHETVGTYVRGGGFALNGTFSTATGTGGLIANSFGVDSGIIVDEDLETAIPTLTDNSGIGNQYPIFYRSGAEWRWYVNNLPYLFTATNILYNQYTGATWQLTQSTNNGRFINYYVCATPSLNSTYRFIIIPSQLEYTSLANAQNETLLNLDLVGMPFQEIAPLWQITYQRQGSYDNNGNCRIEATRKITGTKISIGLSSVTSTNHNNLSNRSDVNSHPIQAINANTPNGIIFEKSDGTQLSDSLDLTWDDTSKLLNINGDILVQSLAGISDRHIGVDSAGKIKVISSTGLIGSSAILDFGNEENYVTVDVIDTSIVGSENILVSYEGAEEVAIQGLNCGVVSKSVGVGYTIFGGAPNGASGQFTVNIIKL